MHIYELTVVLMYHKTLCKTNMYFCTCVQVQSQVPRYNGQNKHIVLVCVCATNALTLM